jgi:urease alpha subunit
MVRNDRTGEVVVDPDGRTVSLDGEPVSCSPASEVPYSGRYLL